MRPEAAAVVTSRVDDQRGYCVELKWADFSPHLSHNATDEFTKATLST